MCANVNLKIALNIYRTWDYQLTYTLKVLSREVNVWVTCAHHSIGINLINTTESCYLYKNYMHLSLVICIKQFNGN